MITLYGSSTSPNVLKIRIMLEESGMPYEERLVKRHEGENRTPEFLKISATGTLPALVDHETGAGLFESTAILLYLADRSQQFLPESPAARAEVYKWLIFETANLSPAIESIYKLYYHDEDWLDGAIGFHQEKLKSVVGIIEQQLAESDYMAGNISIADFAVFPMSIILEDFLEMSLSEFPHLEQWCERMKQRPAVIRATGS